MISWIKSLFSNIRFYILVISVLTSFLISIFVKINYQAGSLQIIALTQFFALTSVIFLYLALMIGPVIRLFPHISYKAKILKSRRSIGVSAFYFAFLHAWNAFFDYLGGFAGIFAMPAKNQLAIFYSSVALVILFFMFATSTDWAVAKMGRYWKRLHQLIYLVAILIFLHATTMGHHFTQFRGWVSLLFLGMLISLIFFHAWGLWKKYKR